MLSIAGSQIIKYENFVTTEKSDCVAEIDAAYIVEKFGDMMYKLAAAQLNNCSDAYDVVQDVLLKILEKTPEWKNSEHVKAWLIRVVINKCRDYNKRFANINTVNIEEVYGISTENKDYELQEAMANLPEKYRITLYLYYYEGYQIKEIAKILKVGESGIKKRLVKGREMLKTHLLP
ncbi:MAG: sigma-70 family RNA polymerase sigma factor [Oscillospiraceae bacterium]|nr:sigma-70 family RNA polymerase sigma factor [Oscillospiraceae bacterium]